MKVVVLDYAVGNVFSIVNAFRRLGADAVLSFKAGAFDSADAVVLPGVGSYPAAMSRLETLRSYLDGIVGSKPILGICLGLQLFFEESLEGGAPVRGLGYLSGRVVPLPPSVKRPHMGWNQVFNIGSSELLEGVPDGSFFYFAHSFYASTSGEPVKAFTDYGVRFPSVVESGGLYGTQFHPEKSGRVGRIVLENFLRIARR